MKILKIISWFIVIAFILVCAFVLFLPFLMGRVEFGGLGPLGDIYKFSQNPYFAKIFTLIFAASIILSLLIDFLFGKFKIKLPWITVLACFLVLMNVFLVIGYEYRYITPKYNSTQMGKKAIEQKSLQICLSIEDKTSSYSQNLKRESCMHQAIILSADRELCKEYAKYKKSDFYLKDCNQILDDIYSFSKSNFCKDFIKKEDGYSYECAHKYCNTYVLNFLNNFDGCYLNRARSDKKSKWCDLIKNQSVQKTCREELKKTD